jgi:hypothetical protein
MSGGYNAKVVAPNLYKVQTESGGSQVPFFFGGSQIPIGLQLDPAKISGQGLVMRSTDPSSQNVNKIKLHLPR